MALLVEFFRQIHEEYLTFLRHHRGLREATLYVHRRWGGLFLEHLAKRLPGTDLSQVTIALIDEFVLPLVAKKGRGTQIQILQAVRGVLRHLQRTGRIGCDWSGFVKGPRRYRLASIPTTISADEVRRLLDSVDRGSALGRRDYAVLLLLAVYGLRAKEIADLRLEDVDWRAAILHVRRSKTARPLTLPLTGAVARALSGYIRHGRPRTNSREIFVCHHGDPTPFRKSSAVYRIVRCCFNRSGVKSPRRGPHVLRHALATHLVQRGFPLKVVGDLLGHQHSDSTLAYTKLAVDDLREVALDVPENLL